MFLSRRNVRVNPDCQAIWLTLVSLARPCRRPEQKKSGSGGDSACCVCSRCPRLEGKESQKKKEERPDGVHTMSLPNLVQTTTSDAKVPKRALTKYLIDPT